MHRARGIFPLLVAGARGYCTDTARGDFEDIFADIKLYGRLLGTEDAANREVAKLRDRVATVKNQPPGGSEDKGAAALIFGRDTPTISAYGDRSTVDQQLDILGLRNVFGDVDKRLIEPNIEEIVDRNPEVVILLLQGTQTPQGVREVLRARPELQNVTAVRDDDIIVLPSGFILPSPTSVEGLETLARELDAIS
ncbi:MAG: ABC transporter substrate-binding protein [Pseudonocardiaceae bacterium]